jgi:hypothetical protein
MVFSILHIDVRTISKGLLWEYSVGTLMNTSTSEKFEKIYRKKKWGVLEFLSSLLSSDNLYITLYLRSSSILSTLEIFCPYTFSNYLGMLGFKKNLFKKTLEDLRYFLTKNFSIYSLFFRFKKKNMRTFAYAEYVVELRKIIDFFQFFSRDFIYVNQKFRSYMT